MVGIDIAVCDECATCVSVCPVDAIILDERITVDNKKCISCGKCIAVCPVAALTDATQADTRVPAKGKGIGA